MKKAIEKLRNQVAEKENLISGIENFLSLNAYEQLGIIQKTDLRYSRKTFLPRWVTSIFGNRERLTTISITPNYIILEWNDYFTIKIPLYDADTLKVESRGLKQLRAVFPVSSEQLETLKVISDYLENHSLKTLLGLKKINPKFYSNRNVSYNHFMRKKRTLRLLEKRKRIIEENIKRENLTIEQNKETTYFNEVTYPKMVKEFENEFLEVLNQLEFLGFKIDYEYLEDRSW